MAKDRVVAVVEARMGSSRLPGKSMRLLAGTPLVERVVERIRCARTLDDVVVATSTSEKDDVLANHLRSVGIEVHRGSEEDVLGRILGASRESRATVHVQCWGDCPFADAGEIDRVVGALLESDADLAGNGLAAPRALPLGLDVIALRVSALERADLATRGNAYHREHGTTFVYQSSDAFDVMKLETPPALHYPSFDATINTAADFEFVEAIYQQLAASKGGHFSFADVVALVRSSVALRAHKNAGGIV